MKAFAGVMIPQAVTNDPTTGHAFVAYYTPGVLPEVAVAEVTAQGKVVSQSVLKDRSGSNSLALYNNSAGLDDSHNQLVIELDADGYVHVAGNMRPYRLMGYWRSAVPHSVASMKYKSQLEGLRYNSGDISIFATSAERVSTYPRFIKTASGELFFGFNHYEPGMGNFYLLRYDTATKSWNNDSGGADYSYGYLEQGEPLLRGWESATTMSPYVQSIDLLSDGYYWMIWSWRDLTTADSNSRISVAKSKDLRTWYTAAGTKLPASIPYSLYDTDPAIGKSLVVRNLTPSGSGHLNNQLSVGLDQAGRAVVAYFAYYGTGDTKRTVIYISRQTSVGAWMDATPVPMQGLYDLGAGISGDTLSINEPATPVPGTPDTMALNYTCNGVARTVEVKVSVMGSYSSLVSDHYRRTSTLPLEATKTDPGSAGYAVAARTTTSSTFTDSDGKTSRWIMKWDGGPYVHDGTKPTWSYPQSGTPLTLYKVASE